MTLDIRVNQLSIQDLLVSPPRINDQANAVCRTLEFSFLATETADVPLGKLVELFYNGKRWFLGFIMRREFRSDGAVAVIAYDPLFFLKKHKDDWLFKNMGAFDIFSFVCSKVGIKVGSIEKTPVMPTLYYEASEADKVCVDILARLYELTRKKYWYRYDPEKGFVFFERKLPENAWAFQTGINLTSATYTESAENLVTAIKLVNRETGAIAQKHNTLASKQYGLRQEMQVLDKEKAKSMDAIALQMLKDLSKIDVTMDVQGINPNATIPQLYSGDVVYVEEDLTQIIGAYWIKDVTQEFVSDSLVQIGMNVTEDPEVPKIQYENAKDDPNKKRGRKKKKKDEDKDDTPGAYSEEMKKVIEKYGL